MRAEITNVRNGTLQGNKFTMVRGDTLEISLRVIQDDETPIPISRYESDAATPNTRQPSGSANNRLTLEFLAALKDGGEVRLIYRTSQSANQVLFRNPDVLTIVFDQRTTKLLPAPLAMNFDMQITEFVDEHKRRTSTVYQGVLQIDKDFTTRY